MKKAAPWWATAVACLVSSGALAQDCVSLLPNHHGGSTGLNFIYPNGSGAVWDQLGSGVSFWTFNCGDQAPPISRSTTFASGLANVAVFYLTNGAPCNGNNNACGCSGPDYDSSGHLIGGTIEVYEYTANGGYCDPGVRVYAHEIGHMLGFDNLDQFGCEQNIMWESTAGGYQYTTSQCSALDSLWTIQNEDPCDNHPPPQGCDNGQDPPGSPIVVDLGRDGFRFTDAWTGVRFDLDADGSSEGLAWVGDPLDAFLVRDLDANGRIDNGRELFGNYTLLRSGIEAGNGFEALAELDDAAAGGNGDGTLDASDSAFVRLGLWLDWKASS